jgi:DNA-binding MarR family transcriptional regulator
VRIFFNLNGLLSPTDSVNSISIADREVLKIIRSRILEGSGLTPEIAELLIELSLPDNLDGEGFISFRDLKNALEYSGALLSRRISVLCEETWAEAKRIETPGVHGNSQKIKITQKGREKIRPVWQRYERLADELLNGISQQDREAHYRVNRHICEKLGSHSLLPAIAVQEAEPEPEFLD